MENGALTNLESKKPAVRSAGWITDLLLILVLVTGGIFRFTGIAWDGNQHLHPDERFLTMVASSVSPVSSLQAYFNTPESNLNPHNRGYTFYVYGTLPLFIVRYAAEWLSQAGYDQISVIGRIFSGTADLITIAFVYLIALRLFKRSWLALLAALFYACSVLPIQLSHYFTVDTFTTTFGMLAFYFAVRVMTDPIPDAAAPTAEPHIKSGLLSGWKSTLPFIFFGLALGMAAASKVNAVVLAVVLPAAAAIRWMRFPREERDHQARVILLGLGVAGLVFFLSFRVFQPYAFSGPGFFGLKPNPLWIANIKELSTQSGGDVDFPPALQWARRPVWFALDNMVKWGLGLPLGLLAWSGFLWMAWKIFRGDWQKNVLIWGWTAVYFTWQSLGFTSSMRYQMLVYPTLAVIGAWAVSELWNSSLVKGDDNRERFIPVIKTLAWIAGLGAAALTLGWAFAFTRIYTRPVTRVAASQWIYQNVPGPINLKVNTSSGSVNQPVAFRFGTTLGVESPLIYSFVAPVSGQATGIKFAHIVDSQDGQQIRNLIVFVSDQPDDQSLRGAGFLVSNFPTDSDPRGRAYSIDFDTPPNLVAGARYYLQLRLDGVSGGLNFAAPISLDVKSLQDGSKDQVMLPDPVQVISKGKPFNTEFTPLNDGDLQEITFPHIVDWMAGGQSKKLQITVTEPAGGDSAAAEIDSEFLPVADIRGENYTAKLDHPIRLVKGKAHSLSINLTGGDGEIALYGTRQANESTWDDPLPLGMDGFNPYDYTSGVYRTELNFEMYWDDNAAKRDRFQSILEQADYLFISSNRQWGTTVRVPERYPLTTEYYRDLIGCPDDKEITWCYSVAQPRMFNGSLGFDLVKVFQSEPSVGSWVFNTQFAEEAFTVYDHPKVLIFKKTYAFDPVKTASLLGAVDITQVIPLTPRKASAFVGNLMLPQDRWTVLRAGGTWTDLFNPDALQNKYPVAGLVLWYLAVLALGVLVYPLMRVVFGGLDDRGYPLGKLTALLLVAYFTWLLGSAGVPATRLTITLVIAGLALVNAGLAWMQRDELRRDLKERWRVFLFAELVFLVFFAFSMLIRLGNPDLWHPYKGGEKPMDFSYLNAVIKSDTFPPYDPWFAGGYINYYYYGFVIVGVLVKWLGIIPALAYNIILPTLFALVGVGAMCVGWNLVSSTLSARMEEDIPGRLSRFLRVDAIKMAAGIVPAVGLLILGNEGTVRMIWHGFQKLAAPSGDLDTFGMLQRWGWSVQGLVKFINGVPMPYPPGDWYWIPSRVIRGESITEFPFFTFLYADLHAHMIALPVTLLVLAWAAAVILGKWNWTRVKNVPGWLAAGLTFFIGALAIGTLRPTNTWDFPTYLVIGCLAVLYTAVRFTSMRQGSSTSNPKGYLIWGMALVLAGALAVLSFVLFQPFSHWFGQGYNAVDFWKGDHTPFWSYITHWILFLFVIVTWLVWETRDWMASTPASSLLKLKPYTGLIIAGLILLLAAVAGSVLLGIEIGWLVLPLMVWCAALIFRTGIADAKRAVLFMTGSALALSLTVELIVLRGDIGRMNTVFKFYFQAWTLFALSAGAALIWLAGGFRIWWPNWRNTWQTVFSLLVIGAAMFPLFGGADKIRDRMSPQAPHSLDGMAFMKSSVYNDAGFDLNLENDYRAIQWVQRNIKGSPVIVEANTVEYRWGSRFTIYTGLPGVVGWNWHQRQQRSILPSEVVTNRVDAIMKFYQSVDRTETLDFLKKYKVKYIIVGKLEQEYYSGPGVEKFSDWINQYWKQVYQDGSTSIYEVLP